MSPLSFLGAIELRRFSFFDKNHMSKQNSPIEASYLGLFGLPTSHKKDVKRIWVNTKMLYFSVHFLTFGYYFEWDL